MVIDTTVLVAPTHRDYVTEKYVLAADLGQSTDPTAIAVLHHSRRESYDMTASERRPEVTERFDVRHLQRLPLGLSYMEVVGEVQRLLARPPLNRGCELVIDETGVGRPVGDLFDEHGLEPTRVTITAGGNQTNVGPRRWHVAKGILISNLDAKLHTGELRFAATLTEAGAMANELKDFRRRVSSAGRFQYEARVGQHDDLVLAVAIGVWTLAGRPKSTPPSFDTY